MQFKETFLEDRISYKDVTKDDLYNNAFNSKNYDNFINRIEDIENRFETSPSKTNLLDLLFTLLANDETIYSFIKAISRFFNESYKMKVAEHFSRGVLANNIERVKILFTNLEEIFDERYFNLEDSSHRLSKEQIENNSDDNPYNNTLKRGSLIYFLVESHSTSRRYMHKELKDFLEKVGAKK